MPKLAFFFEEASENSDRLEKWIHEIAERSRSTKMYVLADAIYPESGAEGIEDFLNRAGSAFKGVFNCECMQAEGGTEITEELLTGLLNTPHEEEKGDSQVYRLWQLILHLSTVPKDVVIKIPEIYPDGIAKSLKDNDFDDVKYTVGLLIEQKKFDEAEKAFVEWCDTEKGKQLLREEKIVNETRQMIERIVQSNENADLLVVYRSALYPIYHKLKQYAQSHGFEVERCRNPIKDYISELKSRIRKGKAEKEAVWRAMAEICALSAYPSDPFATLFKRDALSKLSIQELQEICATSCSKFEELSELLRQGKISNFREYARDYIIGKYGKAHPLVQAALKHERLGK